jgi:phage FluMu protein gp41
MVQEIGTLPIGFEYEGTLRRDYSLRPLQVRDSMAVRKGPDAERALADDELMGLALLGRRLEITGVPPGVLTLEAMERFWDDDLAEVMAAEGRLQEQLARFRGEAQAAADAGAAAGGDTVAGGAEDAGGGSAAVAGGLGGTQGSEEEEGADIAGAAPP